MSVVFHCSTSHLRWDGGGWRLYLQMFDETKPDFLDSCSEWENWGKWRQHNLTALLYMSNITHVSCHSYQKEDFCTGRIFEDGVKNQELAGVRGTAHVKMELCLGQEPCTQHSAMHPGGTKSSLSVSSWASCWKVTSPRLNGSIHLLKSIQFVNRFPTWQARFLVG